MIMINHHMHSLTKINNRMHCKLLHTCTLVVQSSMNCSMMN
jgi:hypothetical protein